MQRLQLSPCNVRRHRAAKGFAATEVIVGLVAVALLAFGIYKLLNTP